MRRWCIKTILFLLCALASLVAVAAILFLVVIHPNDQRIEPLKLSTLTPPKIFYTKVGSLLVSGYQHEMTQGAERLALIRERLNNEVKEHFVLKSARFVSPYQIYIPIGNYPWRLEGRDSLMIPGGAELTVTPKLSGAIQLQVAAVAFLGPAKLIVANDTETLITTEIPEAHIEKEEHGALANAMRYIKVDRGPLASHWLEQRVDIQLKETSQLKLRCESDAGFCLVGDPSFYQKTDKPKESFIIVLVDTLRGDAIEGGNAPTMSRLAENSIQFKRAISPGNMTSPSTNSFLACRKATTLGSMAFAYSVTASHREKYYEQKKPSFAAYFTKGNYDTAMIGNVSVVSEVFGVGVDHGFSQQIAIETEAYDTAQVEREAGEWLRHHADRPFLLYVHFNGPHAPYRAPLRDLISVFPGFSRLTSYAQVLGWLYQGEVRYSDRYLDKFLDAVDRLGLKDRTTVVLTADHGDQHTMHYFAENEVAPNITGAYFDHGATLLNDEINVPLLLRLPEGPRGVENYDFVSTLAVGPTLLERARLATPESCEAASLAPYYDFSPDSRDPKESQDSTGGARVIGSEGFRGRAIIFDGRYKYIRNYAPTDKRLYGPEAWVGYRSLVFNAEELYDLEGDPNELVNLAQKNRRVLLKAREVYRNFYQVKSGYELILEGPVGSVFNVRLGDGAALTPGVEQEFKLEVARKGSNKSLRIIGSLDTEQVLIKFDQFGSSTPEVGMAGQKLDLRATTLRLPYKNSIELPLEGGGAASLLPPRSEPTAYIRRVGDANYQERAIATGNPRFEKILREWGYLHED